MVVPVTLKVDKRDTAPVTLSVVPTYADLVTLSPPKVLIEEALEKEVASVAFVTEKRPESVKVELIVAALVRIVVPLTFKVDNELAPITVRAPCRVDVRLEDDPIKLEAVRAPVKDPVVPEMAALNVEGFANVFAAAVAVVVNVVKVPVEVDVVGDCNVRGPAIVLVTEVLESVRLGTVRRVPTVRLVPTVREVPIEP